MQKEKERKYSRGSGEIAKKKKTGRKWIANEETGGAYTRTYTTITDQI